VVGGQPLEVEPHMFSPYRPDERSDELRQTERFSKAHLTSHLVASMISAPGGRTHLQLQQGVQDTDGAWPDEAADALPQNSG